MACMVVPVEGISCDLLPYGFIPLTISCNDTLICAVLDFFECLINHRLLLVLF
jgi:hypothetical protein